MENNQLSTAQESELKLLGALALVVVLVIGISLLVSARREAALIPTELASDAFSPVILQAKAAYVYDMRTGQVLFAQNEDTRLPLASLTKVMSALVANELAPEHGIISVNPDALKAKGDSGFKGDEKWSLKDIIDFSLISSSNDGMRAVALALGAISRADATTDEIVNDFVGEMNEKASELELKNTYFWNETGLDESDVKGGAYGSARDVSMLMAHILNNYPELLSATKEPESSFRSLDDEVHVAKNTNDIIYALPGLLASKTGYTATAGGNLTIIFDPELGRPVVVTILGSTAEGRFDDVKTLVNATLKYINEK